MRPEEIPQVFQPVQKLSTKQLRKATGIHRQQKRVQNQRWHQVVEIAMIKAKLLANAAKRGLLMDRMQNVARTRPVAR